MIPTKINLRKKTQVLCLEFDAETFELSAEFLRVHSPSAEVKGHAGQGGELPSGKRFVNITKIEPAGNYAIRILFDDSHASGLYTWQYLYKLCTQQEKLWDTYTTKLHLEKKTRDPQESVLTFKP